MTHTPVCCNATTNNARNSDDDTKGEADCGVLEAYHSTAGHFADTATSISAAVHGVAGLVHSLVWCFLDWVAVVVKEHLIPELVNIKPGSVGGFLIIIVGLTLLLSVTASLSGRHVCFYPARCYWAWLFGKQLDVPACTGAKDSPSILEGTMWKMTRPPRCLNP